MSKKDKRAQSREPEFELETVPVLDDGSGERDYFAEYYKAYKNDYITQYLNAYKDLKRREAAEAKIAAAEAEDDE